MLASIRYFFADLAHWLATHRLVTFVAVLGVAGIGVGAYLAATSGSDEPGTVNAPPAPQVVVKEQAPPPEEPTDLGFPAFATKNTTRVAGADPIADAAGVALAVYPSSGGIPGPDAVTLVDAGDWQAGIAAASLVAAPVGAPILITDNGELPQLTASAIRSLAPAGSAKTGGRQVFAIGAAASPAGFDAKQIGGDDPATMASELDQWRTELAGEPEHLLIVNSDEPALAMPAAAWAARSGDPVLFTDADALPKPTAEAIHRHERSQVFVLGDESVISNDVFKVVKKISPGAQRLDGSDSVTNSIDFARYSSGSFGWNINDPGHGFVIANADRPLDAAAAAALSASGTWGPLLVTDDADAPPTPLQSYLLDVKPGYESDPTRAVYNHVWVIGDPGAISVAFQAQVDELAEVTPVSSGSGGSKLGPPPGTPESSPPSGQSKGTK
ncbi:MAG: cell wall-binding repeat-containing protein [Solirubrobacterales bacterium]